MLGGVGLVSLSLRASLGEPRAPAVTCRQLVGWLSARSRGRVRCHPFPDDLAVMLVQLRAPAVIYYASGRRLNVQAGLRCIPSHPRRLSQWVGESVSCTQDRPGYSRVAPPHSLLRSLLIAQRGRRRTERRRRRREAGDRCGCGGRGSGRTRVGGATGSGSGRRRWGRCRGGC